jgi:hypothetical protein
MIFISPVYSPAPMLVLSALVLSAAEGYSPAPVLVLSAAEGYSPAPVLVLSAAEGYSPAKSLDDPGQVPGAIQEIFNTDMFIRGMSKGIPITNSGIDHRYT